MMIGLLWHINANNVMVVYPLLNVVITYDWLNFGLIILLFEHLLSWNWWFPIFLIVCIAVIWSHNLPEWFLNWSHLMIFYNIFAWGNLSSNTASRRCWVALIKLFFAQSSRNVFIEVLGLVRLTTVIMLVLVQEIKARLLRHLFHVT